MQAGLSRRLHDRLEPHAVQQLAQPEGDLLAFLECNRVELGLVTRGFLAGINIGIDIEYNPVGIIQHRALERFERAAVVGLLGRGILCDLGARVPDVKFERARLREPEERRQVVTQQILVRLVFVVREHGNRLDKCRPFLRPVLLIEPLS